MLWSMAKAAEAMEPHETAVGSTVVSGPGRLFGTLLVLNFPGFLHENVLSVCCRFWVPLVAL